MNETLLCFKNWPECQGCEVWEDSLHLHSVSYVVGDSREQLLIRDGVASTKSGEGEGCYGDGKREAISGRGQM